MIERLADAFAELRLLVEQGVLAYPYSTRELVNITRHLQVSEPATAIAPLLLRALGLAWLGRHVGAWVGAVHSVVGWRSLSGHSIAQQFPQRRVWRCSGPPSEHE